MSRHRNKVVATVPEAIAGIQDGAVILVGGFGLSGNAEALIKAVAEKKPRDLTIVSNNAGNLGKGLALWLRAGIVRKVICSYIGNNEDLHQRMANKTIDVEITPQGTLVERMRAAGAGIPAFYTPTGAGTVIAQGKESRMFGDKECVLERALYGDFALVRARKADPFGNLRFWRTARNFNPIMAMAAKMTIAEVDALGPLGSIDPDDVHLPGIFVHRIVEVREHEDPFEYKTNRKR